MVLEYITWNPDPEIFSIGNFAVRWYGVLFALGFLTGYFIMQDFFRREKRAGKKYQTAVRADGALGIAVDLLG